MLFLGMLHMVIWQKHLSLIRGMLQLPLHLIIWRKSPFCVTQLRQGWWDINFLFVSTRSCLYFLRVQLEGWYMTAPSLRLISASETWNKNRKKIFNEIFSRRRDGAVWCKAYFCYLRKTTELYVCWAHRWPLCLFGKINGPL